MRKHDKGKEERMKIQKKQFPVEFQWAVPLVYIHMLTYYFLPYVGPSL
jgi:hypothetical protein